MIPARDQVSAQGAHTTMSTPEADVLIVCAVFEDPGYGTRFMQRT